MKKNSEKTDDTDGVKKDDEEQSKRFLDVAKESDLNEAGNLFNQALRAVKSANKK